MIYIIIIYIKFSLHNRIMSDNNEEYQNTFNDGLYQFKLGQYIYLLQEREFIKKKQNILNVRNKLKKKSHVL